MFKTRKLKNEIERLKATNERFEKIIREKKEEEENERRKKEIEKIKQNAYCSVCKHGVKSGVIRNDFGLILDKYYCDVYCECHNYARKEEK